ncbi:hypothetical protein [Actinoplanes sp. GCM10030250]|uniref:hypothetical protein n=1 Tax=Actinoplanes sp. GCM10030250 TaxID=3273376 RepID=UPI0036210A64
MTIAQEVLDMAAGDPRSPAWQQIWNFPSPDGVRVIPEPAILPWLARTCAAFTPTDRVEVLELAGVVARTADAKSRTAYAPEIAALRVFASEALANEAFHDYTFVRLLMADLGLCGEGVWSSELSVVNGGEVEVDCPECGEELLLCLEPGQSTIEPGLSSELAGRLHAAAVRAGRESVATALSRLFGCFTCPGCSATFDIAGQVG